MSIRHHIVHGTHYFETHKEPIRNTFLIRPAMQIKYALVVMSIIALSCFAVWWEIYNSFSGLTAHGVIQDPLAMPMMVSIGWVVLIKAALFLGLVFILVLALTHYLTGPLHSLEKGIKSVESGDLGTRVTHRKHDELKGLITNFNQMTDSLQDKVASEHEKIRMFSNQLREMSSKSTGETAHELKKMADQLDGALSSFKL